MSGITKIETGFGRYEDGSGWRVEFEIRADKDGEAAIYLPNEVQLYGLTFNEWQGFCDAVDKAFQAYATLQPSMQDGGAS